MANNYNHILTLEAAKRYLRLEPDFTEDDPDVERMINSAFGYIEKQTNHIFKTQDKTYHKDYSGNIIIYDYPINTSTFPEEIFPLYYSGFVKICGLDSIELNVGYTSVEEAPSELIECALQIIKVWYYEAEKNINTTLLPENVKQIIDTNRRFILC
jgi:viroplasmin and RNaseH domain-containing protein